MRLRTLLLGTIVPALGILAAPVLGQGDSTVTALTNGAPADGSEVFYVVRTSASAPKARKLDIDDISAYVASVTGLGDLLGIELAGLGDGDCLVYDLGTETWQPGSCGGSGGGTVTSVAATFPSFLSVSGSPITTSGTLAVSLANQAANRVFAGPATGADAAPTFRALVSGDVPNNAADTTGNAATATALAANGANCSAGQAAAGVDASGAAEGCTAYLTDITGKTIGDLSDVDETGASTGEALVSDGSGSWAPSSAAVCLSNGTNCPASGLEGSTGATNNAVLVADGTGGATVKASSVTVDSGVVTATSLVLGTVPVGSAGTAADPILTVGTGSGVGFQFWEASGQIHLRDSAGTGYKILNLSAVAAAATPFPWRISNAGLDIGSGMCARFNGAAYFNAFDAYLCRTGAGALRIDSDGAGGAADLTVTGDVSVGDDLNITSAGGLARLGAMSGALPTCEAATARAVVFDQTGDLCACPPDGSEWYDVSDGLGTAGDCA